MNYDTTTGTAGSITVQQVTSPPADQNHIETGRHYSMCIYTHIIEQYIMCNVYQNQNVIADVKLLVILDIDHGDLKRWLLSMTMVLIFLRQLYM